jgi:transposase
MEQLSATHSLGHKKATRLQVVLGRADGRPTSEIAVVLRIHPQTVSDTVRRFNKCGVDGLLKQPNHEPPKAPESQRVISRVLKVVQTRRHEAATHRSTPDMAKEVGISHTKVHQILRAADLKPHPAQRCRTSDDPSFERRLEDVVGVYLSPPHTAIVLSIDEKSQARALERAQPILPLRPAIPERQTHDCERHGVTSLYAALNVASAFPMPERGGAPVLADHDQTHPAGELRQRERTRTRHNGLHPSVE